MYIVFQIFSRTKKIATCSFCLGKKTRNNTTKIPNWFEGTLKVYHVSGFIPLAFRSLKSPNQKPRAPACVAPKPSIRRKQPASKITKRLASPKKTFGGSLIFGWYFLKPPNHFLGGGFNPFEKYESNWIICPNRDENKKYLKPPPSISHSRSTSVPGVRRTAKNGVVEYAMRKKTFQQSL